MPIRVVLRREVFIICRVYSKIRYIIYFRQLIVWEVLYNNLGQILIQIICFRFKKGMETIFLYRKRNNKLLIIGIVCTVDVL